MKKHITTNVDQNTVNIRRSTRNTTVNKLSKSRKRPKVVNDDVISSNETDIFGLQARLTTSTIDLATPIKEISPIKKQLSIIPESHSPCQLSCSTRANVNENGMITGAWGMDFVSSSPLFQNFHINHSFFKIFIIIRFSSFDNISRRHTS